MNQKILAKCFDMVAAGNHSRYWMALLMGYKGMPAVIHDEEERRGYRIGQSLAGSLC